MRNKKRILSLVLCIVMVLTIVFQMVACGNATTNTNTESETNTNTNTSTGGGTDTPTDKVGYSIVVKSIGGMPLSGVKVYVADKDGNFTKDSIGTTGANGATTISLPRSSDYQIFLEDAPDGYIVEDSYPMGTTGAVITLASAPIDEDAAGARYQLGDIIHNYTVTVDGVKYTFADILKDKKAIVLNFWFTTCSYCIEEFPDMEASYAKYKDQIALFALNGKLGGDSASSVASFQTAFHYAYGDFTTLRTSLIQNELTKAIGTGISYDVLDKSKINKGFDDTLTDILAADDKGAQAIAIAEAIEAAILQEDKTALKQALADFAADLKEVDANDESALSAVFTAAKANVYDSFALKLPMTKDENDIESCFNITGNPVTIVIDRYGMISFMHQGGIPNEKYFDALFNYYTVRDYEQALFNGIGELTPTEKPNVEKIPTNEEYNAALNSNGANIEFTPETGTNDAEYSWPFVVTEKNGVTAVKPSNYDKDTSYAILHAKVELKAGEAIMFDYFSSSQADYDVLYVLVDGKDIYTISGKSSSWKGCCPYVAIEDGVYDVAFVYSKDYADYDGDDAVYLSNFRVVDKDEVTVEAYIPRYAATDLDEYGADFQNYVDVVLGDDGYYHVGTKDGPILLANLIGYTNFSDDLSITLEISDTKQFIIDGVNYYEDLIKYCNYASNSQLYMFCSVTPTLRTYLEAFVDQYIGVGEGNPNQWLTLCSYYDAYGTDGEQLEDPIKGLASFSAYEVKEDQPNLVEYNRVIMPRGLLYKFVPTKSGVYRFTTNSVYEVNGWIFVGDHDTWVERGDRILYTHSDTGERFCVELLKENPDGSLSRDYTNASMVAYMEAGKEYYIDFAYYDQYQFGKFTFDVKYIGETFDQFIVASPGPFTYEEGTNGEMGDTIAGGIDVILGEDGYYYHKLPNGEKGSKLYADFYQYTSIFTDRSIQKLCDIGAFNFSISEVDQMAIAYLDRYGEDGLRELWGADYEENYKYYQIADVLEGKYHGYVVDGVYKTYGYEYVTDEITGETTMVLQTIPKNAVPAEDYTAIIEKYELLMLDEEGYPERQGCVEVTEELAFVLQLLMDKFTFPGVDHSWTKLCYYYNYLG